MNLGFKAANDLLLELGVSSAEDIDIEAIAFYCGARVQYKPLDGCAARLIGSGDKAIVTIDETSIPARRRFSIAHELGHWMRDRGKTAYVCTDRDISAPWYDPMNPETGANRYAADLLMPEFLFKPAAKGRQMTMEHARQLASLFKTSLTATAIRFVQYGPLPAMLVFHWSDGRSSFIRGPDVPDSIWPTKELSHNSAAFTALFGGTPQARPQEIDADEWINHRDADRYTVTEDCVKTTDDCVMTLVWWKNQKQLTDLEED